MVPSISDESVRRVMGFVNAVRGAAAKHSLDVHYGGKPWELSLTASTAPDAEPITLLWGGELIELQRGDLSYLGFTDPAFDVDHEAVEVLVEIARHLIDGKTEPVTLKSPWWLLTKRSYVGLRVQLDAGGYVELAPKDSSVVTSES